MAWLYHRQRVTLAYFQLSQLFVSHVNGSPRFVRKCMKSWLAQVSLGWLLVTLYPGQLFSIKTGLRDG